MSKLLEQINSELETKETVPLANLMSQITSKVNKIQKSDYLKFGLVPIYDQGDNDVSGYSNDVSNAYNGKLPVVIFGDHTLRLKRISSPFFLGADGNQLIEPLDENILDRNYFYYLLLSKKPRSYGYERHFKYLKEVEVKVPNLPTQKKIAEILSAYDAKIENNNFIIKKLEATAQTLFDEWFVNFKFPEYEKVKFVDSEMGEIPEGWEIKSLDQIADFLNGVASQKYPAINPKESLPVIKIREMNSGVDQNSDRATREIDKKYIIKNGDILFAWSGSLSLMTWVGGEGVLNQHIFKVTSEDYPKWFVYHWVQRHLQNFKIIAEGKATTMGHIQRHHLSESLVIVPTKPILIKANKTLSNLFDQQILLQEENVSLKSQRDQLLVKLI